jgi:hypothetical protein
MSILCQNFSVDYCYPFFRSVSLISIEDQEEIKAERTSSQKTNKLLEIIMTKDVQLAFNTLKRYIREKCGHQEFLINFLDAELQRFTV